MRGDVFERLVLLKISNRANKKLLHNIVDPPQKPCYAQELHQKSAEIELPIQSFSSMLEVALGCFPESIFRAPQSRGCGSDERGKSKSVNERESLLDEFVR